jgi:hypothetical protein
VTEAPRSTARDYARLAAKLALFAAPLAVFCGLPIWALDRLGELRCLDVAALARDQVVREEDVLYGPAYTDCAQQLKMVGTLSAKAEVVLLGTSRSLQVRREFFRAPFYNAGAATSRAGDLRPFLAKIPREGQPRVLFVVLDQFLLNEATDRHVAAEYRPLDEALTSCVPPVGFLEENWPRVWRDLLARKVPAGLVFRPGRADRLGVRAKVLGSGYRRDGSFRIAGPESFDEVRDRMAKGLRRYEFADDPSPSMVEEIDGFLADAEARGIRVVAILPPYAPTIYDEMQAIGRWHYVEKVHAALAPRFAAHGQTIWDYTDTRSIGLGDREFYDGFHGSERAYAAILADVAAKDATMASVVDSAGIAAMLRDSSDPLSVVRGD